MCVHKHTYMHTGPTAVDRVTFAVTVFAEVHRGSLCTHTFLSAFSLALELNLECWKYTLHMTSKYFLLAGDSNSFMKPDCLSWWSWITKRLTDSPHGKASVVSCCFSYCEILIKISQAFILDIFYCFGRGTKNKYLRVTLHKTMRYFSFIWLQSISFKHKRALCHPGSGSQMV